MACLAGRSMQRLVPTTRFARLSASQRSHLSIRTAPQRPMLRDGARHQSTGSRASFMIGSMNRQSTHPTLPPRLTSSIISSPPSPLRSLPLCQFALLSKKPSASKSSPSSKPPHGTKHPPAGPAPPNFYWRVRFALAKCTTRRSLS